MHLHEQISKSYRLKLSNKHKMYDDIHTNVPKWAKCKKYANDRKHFYSADAVLLTRIRSSHTKPVYRSRCLHLSLSPKSHPRAWPRPTVHTLEHHATLKE